MCMQEMVRGRGGRVNGVTLLDHCKRAHSPGAKGLLCLKGPIKGKAELLTVSSQL